MFDFYFDRNLNKEIWFYVVVVWDKIMNKVYLYFDGIEVGIFDGLRGFDLIEFKYIFYDIGLKRDVNYIMKGYLRN